MPTGWPLYNLPTLGRIIPGSLYYITQPTMTMAATSTTGWYDNSTSSATTTTLPTGSLWQLVRTVDELRTVERLVSWTETRPSVYVPPVSSPAIIRRRTPDEERELVQRMARADQETRERRERDAAAQARANELLLEHLTPAQRETFLVHGWFVVEGGRSKRQYRVETYRGYSGNVLALNERGVAVQRYCAHCDPGIAPGHDQFLAQKMMLEYAEDDFLRIANRH